MMTRVQLPILACLLAAAWACGDDATPPMSPTPVTITEVFGGRLNPNGATTHPFSTTSFGTVSALLSSVEPNTNVTVGLSLGTWTGNACQVVVANDAAVRSTTVFGSVGAAGDLCVRVYDVGELTGSITYEILVEHP